MRLYIWNKDNLSILCPTPLFLLSDNDSTLTLISTNHAVTAGCAGGGSAAGGMRPGGHRRGRAAPWAPQGHIQGQSHILYHTLLDVFKGLLPIYFVIVIFQL